MNRAVARAVRLGVPTVLAAAALRRGASGRQRLAATVGLLGFWSAAYAKYRAAGLEQTARERELLATSTAEAYNRH